MSKVSSGEQGAMEARGRLEALDHLAVQALKAILAAEVRWAVVGAGEVPLRKGEAPAQDQRPKGDSRIPVWSHLNSNLLLSWRMSEPQSCCPSECSGPVLDDSCFGDYPMLGWPVAKQGVVLHWMASPSGSWSFELLGKQTSNSLEQAKVAACSQICTVWAPAPGEVAIECQMSSSLAPQCWS